MLPNWFEFNTSFTVEGWIRPSRLFLGTFVEGAVISCLVTDKILLRFSGFGVTTTGENFQGLLNFRVTFGANQGAVSGAIRENEWQHFAGVFDKGGDGGGGTCANPARCAPARILLYLGGAAAGAPVSFGGPGPVNFVPSQALTIGRHAPVPGSPSSDGFFAGQISELRVWSRALSPADVLYAAYALYSMDAGRAGRLEARWPMNQNECTPLVCRTTNQQWIFTGSTFVVRSSPDTSPKCLATALASSGATQSANGMLLNVEACGTSPRDYMRWIRFPSGLLQPTDASSSCLAAPAPPSDSVYAYLDACPFPESSAAGNLRWSYNDTSLQLVSQGAGLCLTAAGNINRAAVFVAPCYDIAPGTRPTTLAVEVMNEQHGTLRGGAAFFNGTGAGCCAPIDQPPSIQKIGLANIVSAEQSVAAAATVNVPLVLDVTASDLNQNDAVTLVMIVPPANDAIFARRTDVPGSNPVVYRFSWTPLYSTQWSNPALAIFEAYDTPVNEFDPSNSATRGYSPLATLSVATVTPPTLVFPTPAPNAVLVGDFGIPVNFQIRAESRNAGDEVRVVLSADGAAADTPPPPPERVVVGVEQPTQTQSVTGQIQFVYNPTTRSYTFTPAPSDAGRVYSVCFLGRVTGKEGLAGQTRLQCVFISVPTTQPIYAAGSEANNTRLVTTVGCAVSFAVTSGKNDTSVAYTLSVTPRTTLYARLGAAATPVAPGPLPPGARFARDPGPAGPAGAGAYSFAWEPQRGQEGNWTVCLELGDSLDITTVIRCIRIDVIKCLRCVQAGETIQTIADLYRVHWLELYTVNPQLQGRPDTIASGQVVHVGVVYEVKVKQSLQELARRLDVTPAQVRGLNPDLQLATDATTPLSPGDRLCLLPPLCGAACGQSPSCRAEWARRDDLAA